MGPPYLIIIKKMVQRGKCGTVVTFITCTGSYSWSMACRASRILHRTCKGCGSVHAIPLGCGERWEALCPDCSAHYTNRYRRLYRRKIQSMVLDGPTSLLTVTLRRKVNSYEYETIDCGRRTRTPTTDEYREQARLVEKLVSHFHRLRLYLRRGGFRIVHFVWVCEYPRHAHAVVQWERRSPSRSYLSKTWYAITKNSFIVDNRPVTDWIGAAKYISKYLSTGRWPKEMIRFMDSVHIMGSWCPVDKLPSWPCDCGSREYLLYICGPMESMVLRMGGDCYRR